MNEINEENENVLKQFVCDTVADSLLNCSREWTWKARRKR